MNQISSIYKLSSPETDYVYYGSTKGSLERCLNKQKSHFKMWRAGKFNYVSSFEVITDADCRIELVEEFTYAEKRELNARLQMYIKADNDSTNRRVLTCTEIREQKEKAYKKN